MRVMIDVKLNRSGKWWAAEVPVGDRTFYTQGRDLAEVKMMAEDVLKMCAEDETLPNPESMEVNLVLPRAFAADIAAYRSDQEAALVAAEKSRKTQSTLVARLRGEGVKVADIAAMLGITKGRVSQLAKA